MSSDQKKTPAKQSNTKHRSRRGSNVRVGSSEVARSKSNVRVGSGEIARSKSKIKRIGSGEVADVTQEDVGSAERHQKKTKRSTSKLKTRSKSKHKKKANRSHSSTDRTEDKSSSENVDDGKGPKRHKKAVVVKKPSRPRRQLSSEDLPKTSDNTTDEETPKRPKRAATPATKPSQPRARQQLAAPQSAVPQPTATDQKRTPTASSCEQAESKSAGDVKTPTAIVQFAQHGKVFYRPFPNNYFAQAAKSDCSLSESTSRMESPAADTDRNTISPQLKVERSRTYFTDEDSPMSESIRPPPSTSEYLFQPKHLQQSKPQNSREEAKDGADE